MSKALHIRNLGSFRATQISKMWLRKEEGNINIATCIQSKFECALYIKIELKHINLYGTKVQMSGHGNKFRWSHDDRTFHTNVYWSSVEMEKTPHAFLWSMIHNNVRRTIEFEGFFTPNIKPWAIKIAFFLFSFSKKTISILSNMFLKLKQ